jgi:hypothetical protein
MLLFLFRWGATIQATSDGANILGHCHPVLAGSGKAFFGEQARQPLPKFISSLSFYAIALPISRFADRFYFSVKLVGLRLLAVLSLLLRQEDRDDLRINTPQI